MGPQRQMFKKFRLLKLAVTCILVTTACRLLVLTSITKYDDVGRMDVDNNMYVAPVIPVDTANAGHMPRDAQLEGVRGLIKDQNACPSVRRPTQTLYNEMGFWQRTNFTNVEVLVYSAFYDDRPALGLIPGVQILGVSTSVSDIYCYLWYDNIDTPFVTKANVQKSGRGDKMKGIFYGQYVFSCNLPGAHPVPTHVSLTFGICNSSTIYLPIFLPVRSQWSVEFGICVAISYGNISRQDFIEWMELNHILGVQEVHIYNGTMDPSLNSLFQMYRKENRLFVHSMPPPKDIPTKMGSKLGSPASINDCMLRFMYRYRYILVIDFDEVIIPRTSDNLHDMIIKANKHHKLTEDMVIYTFANTYFYTNFKKTGTNSLALKTLEYQKSMKPSPAVKAPKSIVDPRRCFSMFNHYCYIQFPQYFKYRMFQVNNTIARSHHYKNCLFGKNCTKMEANATVDTVVGKYNKKLTLNVEKRLQMYDHL